MKLSPIFAVLTGLALLAAGCGDTDTEEPALRYDITNAWSGTWQGGSVNGSLSCDLATDSDAIVTGECILDGNPCLEENQVYGYIDQESGDIRLLILDRELSEEERDARDIDGEINDISAHSDDEGYLGSTFEHTIATTGNFDPESETIFLNYTVAEWAFCDGATGTIQLAITE